MQPFRLVKENTRRLRKKKDLSSWINPMYKSLAKNSILLRFFQCSVYIQSVRPIKENTNVRKKKDLSSQINPLHKSLAKNSFSLCLFQYVCWRASHFGLLKYSIHVHQFSLILTNRKTRHFHTFSVDFLLTLFKGLCPVNREPIYLVKTTSQNANISEKVNIFPRMTEKSRSRAPRRQFLRVQFFQLLLCFFSPLMIWKKTKAILNSSQVMQVPKIWLIKTHQTYKNSAVGYKYPLTAKKKSVADFGRPISLKCPTVCHCAWVQPYEQQLQTAVNYNQNGKWLKSNNLLRKWMTKLFVFHSLFSLQSLVASLHVRVCLLVFRNQLYITG